MAARRGSASRLGAQIWFERNADHETIDHLVGQAAAVGLGLLRVFLIWPWVEPAPGEWDFRVFDDVFETAHRHDLRIKATLTANSGPWHVGAPSALHSHTLIRDPDQRAAVDRYVGQCVRQYAGHPALAQWLIWNEPFNVLPDPGQPILRTSGERSAWTVLVERRHGGDISELNRRWRTGYESFARVGFPEEIADPTQRGSAWLSYGPWIDEFHHRADYLRSQLAWIAGLVRANDDRTPLGANPSFLFNNHALAGYEFPGLASTVDVVGASFHPPWSFDFVPPARYTAVMVAATSFLRNIPGVREVEVTETQVGNVERGSPNPRSIGPSEIAAYYLAPQLAGARSVTGWSLNARRQDYEAGDWGLLDDDGHLTARSAAVERVARCLDELEDSVGPWRPSAPRALVVSSSISQAIELIESRINAGWESQELAGRRRDDAVQGMYLLTAALLCAGVAAAAAPIEALQHGLAEGTSLIVASHLIAYDESDGERLLQLVEGGATLLLDGTSGQKTPDACLHGPWPGVLAARLGFRARGLATRTDGWPVMLHGAAIGRMVLTTADLEVTDPAWAPWRDVRVGDDLRPLVWERSVGTGRVILVTGPLGPSLVADAGLDAFIRHIVARSVPELIDPVSSISPDTFTLVVDGSKGQAVGVFAPDRAARGGRSVRLRLPTGRYRDLWDGHTLEAMNGEATIDPQDGIAILVGPSTQ